MSRSLQDYQTQIGKSIREKTGGIVEADDIKESMNRGIRDLIQKHGVAVARDRASVPVFPTVYENPMPSGFLHPEKVKSLGAEVDFDFFSAVEFWKKAKGWNNIMAIDNILDTSFLLIKSDAGEKVTLHTCDDLTSNGTWASDTAASDAANLIADTLNYESGSGSLRFDLDVSQSVNDYAQIYNTTLAAVDVSTYESLGWLFGRVYLPDATNVSSITVEWGDDLTANYWSKTVTAPYLGGSFYSGWNRIGLEWSSATENGSPDASAVSAVRVKIAYSSGQTDLAGFRVDDLMFALPRWYQLDYFSSNMVKTSAGAYQEYFVSTDDESTFSNEDDDVLYYYAMADSQLVLERYAESALMEQKYEKMAKWMAIRHGTGRKRPVGRYYRRYGGRRINRTRRRFGEVS